MTNQKVLENKIRKIKEDPNLSEKNKDFFIKFKDECVSLGLSVKRTLKYLYTLHTLAKFFSKDFDTATKDDIKQLVAKIETSEYTDWTKRDFKVVIKRFYQWLYQMDDGEYPDIVKWIKKKEPKLTTITPESVLIPEDIQKMVEKADNIRDRCLLITLYESGARYHEFCNIKRSGVDFPENGELAKLYLESTKTLSRTVTLIESIPYLRIWLQHHPLKNHKDFYMWVSVSNNGSTKNKPLSYNALSSLLSRVAKEAGITKPTNPHAFRHARANYLAKKLSDAALCRFFGWYPGSKMVRTYSHLNDNDIEKELLDIYGFEKSKQLVEEKKKFTKPCPRCKRDNQIDSDFCGSCWLNLSVEEAQLEQLKFEFANNVLEKGFEKTEFRHMLKEIVKEVLTEQKGL